MNHSIRITVFGSLIMIAGLCAASSLRAAQDSPQDGAAALIQEIKSKGWILYCARSDNGSWDLFASRPDGSHKRNITNTPDFEEAAPLLSHDNQKLLFRRLPKGATIDHDLWGFQGRLIVADADGSNPRALGEDKEFPWASWSPDGRRIACLDRKGIHIVDVQSRQTIRSLPRKGIYQQLFWSPDGKWFTGTGNHAGAQWSVVRMDALTGELNPIVTFQSCTPDWRPDSNRIIFSSRPANQSPTNSYGWTQLYIADGDGQNMQLIYGEDGFHIYGGVLSPDGAYALFTKCTADGGGAEEAGAPMCIMRMSDAPVIAGPSPFLEPKYPGANSGPVAPLTGGWEPIWTYAELFSE
ncbi:MAG: PD40 domain-containing protein [Candidatus Omnitrophica bacterium]|nr:PD40 domain-containing protein [Candidatus Omnitrophota bacterium]